MKRIEREIEPVIDKAFPGRYEDALKTANPDKWRSSTSKRSPNRNLFGIAHFHLGNYSRTVSSFETTAEMGGPVAPISFVFLAAAHDAFGNVTEAREHVQHLMRTWPKFQVESTLLRFYRTPEQVDSIIRRLKHAGWKTTE